MLSEHGLASLQVVSPSATSVMLMRAPRAELAIDLVNARAVLRRVLSGDYPGTLPEMELLAQKLRAASILP
jgi:hypothetical protein